VLAADRIQSLLDLAETLPSVPVGMPAKKAYAGGTLAYELRVAVDSAVCLGDIPAGVVLPEHSHEVLEHNIIVKGKGWVTVNGDKREVKRGDCVTFQPGEIHQWGAVEDTLTISITIPPDKGYPGVGP